MCYTKKKKKSSQSCDQLQLLKKGVPPSASHAKLTSVYICVHPYKYCFGDQSLKAMRKENNMVLNFYIYEFMQNVMYKL